VYPSEPKPREWFEKWRQPGEFVREAHKAILVYDKTPPQYLRDAYLAGSFARIWRDDRGPCEVRLVPEPEKFPDAQLWAGHTYLHLEITMALKKGRRMFKEHQELRDKAKRGEIVLAESHEQLQASAREAIPRVVKQKANKHYAGQTPTTLLVCANTSLSAQEMAHLTEPWKDCFDAIYLLCGMDAVMAWPQLDILRGREPS
jgi:hypothetical protein